MTSSSDDQNLAPTPGAPQKRRVSPLLGLGIVFFPLIFSWALLRSGHSALARIIGLIWFFVGGFITLIVLLLVFDAVTPTPPETAEQSQQGVDADSANPASVYEVGVFCAGRLGAAAKLAEKDNKDLVGRLQRAAARHINDANMASLEEKGTMTENDGDYAASAFAAMRALQSTSETEAKEAQASVTKCLQLAESTKQ